MAGLGVSPDEAYSVLKILDDTWSLASERMLEAVARRLARGITEDGWAERKAREVLALRGELAGIMNRVSNAAPAQVQAALVEAHGIGAKAAATLGRTAIDSRPQEVQQLATRLTGQLQGSVLPVIRSHTDLFQRAVIDSELAIATGTTTRREEVARTVDRLLAEGRDRFVDARGRRWHLDAYARMAGRTTAAQTAVQGQLDQMVNEGRDLVIISDSARECERCRPWEGRLLSVTGASVGETVDGRRVTGTVAEARGAGLWHPNCRHRADPYTPGLTQKPPAKADPEGAKAEEKLRALERRARELKRRQAAVEQLGDTATARKLRQQIKANSARIKQHTEETGLLRRRDRERPLGAGTPAKPTATAPATPPSPAPARPQAARADRPEPATQPDLDAARERRVDETVRRVQDPDDQLTTSTLLDDLADGAGTDVDRRVWADAVRRLDDVETPAARRVDTDRADADVALDRPADTPAPAVPPPAPGMQAGGRFVDDREAVDWALRDWPLPDLTDAQRAALRTYTSDDYTIINGRLRGHDLDVDDMDRARDVTNRLDEVFAVSAAPEAVIVHRGVGSPAVEAMGGRLSDPASMQALVGRVYEEPGYLSTSIGSGPVFHDNPAFLMLRVPRGGRAINAMHVSEFGDAEREILLDRSSRIVIHAAYKHGNAWYIEAEVVPPGWTPGPDWAPDPYGDAWEGHR